MSAEPLKLLRARDVFSFLLYVVIVSALAAGVFLTWPSPDTETLWPVVVLGSCLFVALLVGLPASISYLPQRRRLIAFANVVTTKRCEECGALHELWAVERTAHLTSPMCGGSPETEDLRERWLVQCANCGDWSGYGDDGTPISGDGVILIPLHNSIRRPAEP